MDDEARHAAHDRQIGDQCGELRSKLADDVFGQRRLRQRSTVGAPSAMTAIFSDVRRNRRQLRHLMPSRVAGLVARAQRLLTVPTAFGHQIDGRVHALGEHHRP